MTDDMQRAKELLAMCLDEWGCPTEASNVRAGKDLESYEGDFRLLNQLRVWGLMQYPQEPAALCAAPEGFVMVPVDELQRAIDVLRYGSHPQPSPHADVLAAMLAARPQTAE